MQRRNQFGKTFSSLTGECAKRPMPTAKQREEDPALFVSVVPSLWSLRPLWRHWKKKRSQHFLIVPQEILLTLYYIYIYINAIYTKVCGHPFKFVDLAISATAIADRCIKSSTQSCNLHRQTLAVDWLYWRAQWHSTWQCHRMPPFQKVSLSNFFPTRVAPGYCKCCYCEVETFRSNNGSAPKW